MSGRHGFRIGRRMRKDSFPPLPFVSARVSGATLWDVPRWSYFALLLTPLCGCSNVLGLDDLEFEEPQALTSPTSTGGSDPGSGGSGGAVDAQGSGGEIVISAGGQLPEEYPAIWPQDVIVTSLVDDDENSAYWFYDPHQETLHSFRYSLEEPDLQAQQAWTGAWTHLLAFERAGEDALTGYDAELGFMAEAESTASGEFSFSASDVGTAGRDLLLSVPLSDEAFTFAYTSESGSYRLFSTDSESETSLCMGELRAGWTQAIPFSLSEIDGILFMNEESGEFQFNSLLPCGEGAAIDIVLEHASVPRIIFSFPQAPSDQLFLYFSDGEILVYDLVLSDDGTVRTALLDSGYFRGDLTSITPLRAAGEPAALTYDARTGVAQVHSLVEPIDKSVVVK